MWKHVMEFTVLLLVWLCPTDLASFPRFGLRALDSVLDEGSSHLKSENKLLKFWNGPKTERHLFKWREHRRDGEEGQAVRAVTCASTRNQRNHGGNSKYSLTVLHIWNSRSPLRLSLQHHHLKKPNHPLSPPIRSWTWMDSAAPKAQTSTLYLWKQLWTSLRALAAHISLLKMFSS